MYEYYRRGSRKIRIIKWAVVLWLLLGKNILNYNNVFRNKRRDSQIRAIVKTAKKARKGFNNNDINLFNNNKLTMFNI